MPVSPLVCVVSGQELKLAQPKIVLVHGAEDEIVGVAERDECLAAIIKPLRENGVDLTPFFTSYKHPLPREYAGCTTGKFHLGKFRKAMTNNPEWQSLLTHISAQMPHGSAPLQAIFGAQP